MRHLNRVLGLDGKSYPVGGQRSPDVRDYLIGRVHYLSHAEGLSIRGIVTLLREEWPEMAPAVGTVSAWLKIECVECCRANTGDA